LEGVHPLGYEEYAGWNGYARECAAQLVVPLGKWMLADIDAIDYHRIKGNKIPIIHQLSIEYTMESCGDWQDHTIRLVDLHCTTNEIDTLVTQDRQHADSV